MHYDVSQSVPQGSDRTQEEENLRIAAIADELERLCTVYETQFGEGEANVGSFEVEQRTAERMAKERGFWIPMTEIFSLGVPGPSGNENDTYVSEKVVYKVNNLLNSGSIVALLRRLLMHNEIFPDTAYMFHGFAGIDGRSVYPVIIQPRVANAHPATQIMIDTYRAAIGFDKADSVGCFINTKYEVWDIVPRNALIDNDGDVYVIDSEIKIVELPHSQSGV